MGILFPDPWGKIKHYKRRLVNLILLKLILETLIVKGYLHVTTDMKLYSKLIILNFYRMNHNFIILPLVRHTMINKKTKFQN